MPYAGGEGRHKAYGMRSLDEIEGLEDVMLLGGFGFGCGCGCGCGDIFGAFCG